MCYYFSGTYIVNSTGYKDINVTAELV